MMRKVMSYDEWWKTIGRDEQIEMLLEKGWDVDDAEMMVDRYNLTFKYGEEYTEYTMLADEIIGYDTMMKG